MIPVNLTAEDFKELHNGKCKVYAVLQRLEGVVNPAIESELRDALAQLNRGLANAYEQEEAADKVREAAIEAAEAGKNFKSVWSMDNYDFVAKVEPKPISVTYRNHWGPAGVSVEVIGDTWLDLWEAADKAIRYSGDDHHIFIEDLKHIGDGVYELSTGS